jgi:hypothetical protein
VPIRSLARIGGSPHARSGVELIHPRRAAVSIAGMVSHSTVCVDLSGGGDWEVTLPGKHDGVTFETLDEAQRLAFLYAADRRPCELVVRDAYRWVLHREFIAGEKLRQPGSLADIESR